MKQGLLFSHEVDVTLLDDDEKQKIIEGLKFLMVEIFKENILDRERVEDE